MNSRHTLHPNILIIFFVVAGTILLSIDRTTQLPLLRLWSSRLYGWVLLLAAFGLLLGIVNVIGVHLRRIQQGKKEWLLSVVLLAAFSLILVIGLTDSSGILNPLIIWSFDNVIAPLQATLFALLAFFLAAAAYRHLRVNRIGGVWILVGALLMLLLQMPMARIIWQPQPDLLQLSLSQLQGTLYWLIQEPIMAALRGMLLGSSIALLVVTLHFLVGSNR